MVAIVTAMRVAYARRIRPREGHEQAEGIARAVGGVWAPDLVAGDAWRADLMAGGVWTGGSNGNEAQGRKSCGGA
uniref:Uncharacterized protein n=1 Tax=Oryza meridionalis TaxID=40149 RepID=A0A0E0D5U0_9ORYZ